MIAPFQSLNYDEKFLFLFQVRIIDCYLVEGYKIFYRIGFALLRIFVKYLRLGTSKWHGLIKSRGLVGGFMYFCTEIPVRIYTVRAPL